MLPPYQRLGRVVRLPWATKLSYSTANRFQVKAAELHYPRIPRLLYWEHRIKMCKALGGA